MSSLKTWRWGPLLIILALFAFTPAQGAVITPESDVLLPYFEVDLEQPETGLYTTFSLVNAAPYQVRARATVYTNWGIPVLEVPLLFERTAAKTLNLRAWIVSGILPDRTLTAAQLANLQAMLTGKPSPDDGLYYGTAVEGGLAVGYVIVETLDDRPDTLWGDLYEVDLAADCFEAETLAALTHEHKAECKQHGIRFVNEGQLFEASELIVWSGRRFKPSRTPTPEGAKVKIVVGVYDQAGNHVQDCLREFIAVETLQVCHLDITPGIGWLDVKTEDPTIILEHLHSITQAGAELHSYCLDTEAQADGPAIAIEKSINGFDADRPLVVVNVGESVEFNYHVTNTGPVPLSEVIVVDDTGIEVTCPLTSLYAGQSMDCTAQELARECTAVNTGTASGKAPDGTIVSASDQAMYEGKYAPALTLELLVNDSEADEATGPEVVAGQTLYWSLVVTNSGNAQLTGVDVSLNGTPVICAKTTLDIGESMTCTAVSIANPGQRHEIGTVTAADPCAKNVSATDPAYYFGKQEKPGIEIRKLIGDNDADHPPGPKIPVGSTIEWRFIVTNTGDVPLTGIVVADSLGIVPNCPKSSLAPGESMTCTATSLAAACDQRNIGTVTATRLEGEGTVVDADDAYYAGETAPGLSLALNVNGQPADEPPGEWVDEGSTLSFTYLVTNTGNVELTAITVNDDHDGTVNCPKGTLMAGESMTCTATAVAAPGMHDLMGVARASEPYGPECAKTIQVQNAAHYRVRAIVAGIDVLKMTNGVHVDAAPGPKVPLGSTVTWTYLVTNTGTVPLSNVSVTDSGGVGVTCPKTTLDPSESMTCSATGIAKACQYANTAVAQGHPPAGEPVTASDDSFYFGEHAAAISIDKRINGEDAATGPGPTITAGSTIDWSFIVTNTGNVTLTGVGVTDTYVGAVACPKTVLEPGESMTCNATGPALSGAQRNAATASGNPPCGADVTASDTCFYTGVTPAILIEKLINGLDADDAAHAVVIAIGAPVQWSFVVTNIGDIALSNVSVTDDKLASLSCPKTTLLAGESMTCTASGFAVEGMECDTGTATGTSPQDVTVTDTDSACYNGGNPAITLQKLTNGTDANTPTGPVVMAGSTVYWTYIVTNTGTVPLLSISVTDDQGVTVTCPKTVLDPSESMTCTASGIATKGQYSNIGTVTGTPTGGTTVTASDPSHYFGLEPSIELQKLANGDDADDAAHAVLLMTGDTVNWSFVVTNTGNVTLSDIAVTDATVPLITCPRTGLAPGESMTCTASGIAVRGPACNTAYVTGTSPQAVAVQSTDTACYLGRTASITVKKYTNGSDADTPTGPQINAGATVNWTYVVTNTGDVQLTAVGVTDNRGVTVTCPKSVLDSGEAMTCTASGTATAGQYSNTGTATGTAPNDLTVTASDPSHYIGIAVNDQGCTPGYWKNHTGSWPAAGWSPSQPVTAAFGQASSYPALGSATLWDALSFGGGSGVEGAAEILLRAAVAALLNASHPNVNYPTAPAGVTTDVDAALATHDRDTMLSLAAALDAANNLGCPLN